MANIPVEKKSSVWPWVLLALGLLAALLVFLWVMAPEEESATVNAGSEVDRAFEPGEVRDAATNATLASAATSYGLVDVLDRPLDFAGRDDFAGEVAVPSVPTDRGFWIAQDDARMFAVIIDGPEEVPVDINSGQTLRVENGMLRDKTFLGDFPGEPLEDDTLNILSDQDIFLIVHENDIEILSSKPENGSTELSDGT